MSDQARLAQAGKCAALGVLLAAAVSLSAQAQTPGAAPASDPQAVAAVLEALAQDTALFGQPGAIGAATGLAATGTSRVGSAGQPGVCERQVFDLVATPSPAAGVPRNVRVFSRSQYGFMTDPSAPPVGPWTLEAQAQADLDCYHWAEAGGVVATEAPDVYVAMAGARAIAALASDAEGARRVAWVCDDGDACPTPDRAQDLLRPGRIIRVASLGGPDGDGWTLLIELSDDADAEWVVVLSPDPAANSLSPNAHWSARTDP